MACFATYCSAAKDPSTDLLPALERYHSARIRQVFSAALAVGADFLILSGQFGLLRPGDPIPFYDHLLTRAEVAEHTRKLEEQLRSAGWGQLVFFTQPLARDPSLGPYHDCLRAACRDAGVELVLVELPANFVD